MKKLKLEELGRISIDEFKESEKLPVCIVLDNVRSLHNVGSAFRTADAFRVERLFLCGINCPYGPRELVRHAATDRACRCVNGLGHNPGPNRGTDQGASNETTDCWGVYRGAGAELCCRAARISADDCSEEFLHQPADLLQRPEAVGPQLQGAAHL